MRLLVTVGAATLFIFSSIYLAFIYFHETSVPLWSFMIYASTAYFCLGILFGNMHRLNHTYCSRLCSVNAAHYLYRLE